MAFDYPNNSGYGIPLVIKASKSGLVKAFKANHDPEATEFKMFRDSFNAVAFYTDKITFLGFTCIVNFKGLKNILKCRRKEKGLSKVTFFVF